MSRLPLPAATAGLIAAALAALTLAACGSSAPSGPTASRGSALDTAKYAWAVGYCGTIIATTDGGSHWSPQSSGTEFHLFGVCFADTRHGWAVGGATEPTRTSSGRSVSLVLATTDGGSHWVPQSEAPGEPLGRVACADASHVWVTGGGQRATILASSDGGRTWTTQYTDDALSEIQEIAFADKLHGWAINRIGGWNDSRAAELLATTDGGLHWQVQKTFPGTPIAWAIAFADTTHGWVIGGLYADGQAGYGGQVWSTSDGGATWTRLPEPQGDIVELDAVTCSDREHVWIGATGREPVFRSTDGGRTWLEATEGIGRTDVRALAFGDSSHGWALTQNGIRIVATTDGGATWRRQAAHVTKFSLIDIACPRSP